MDEADDSQPERRDVERAVRDPLSVAANVVRAVDAVTNKPETGSTVTLVTTPMKQVATIQSGLPNVYLESQAFNTIIETDLRLALNEGLDKLILDAIAGSGFQAPGTDPLIVSIRKAITTLQGNGYNPDTLLLTPANAEALDVLVSGISGGTNDYVFGPENFASGIFNLNKRISKTIPARRLRRRAPERRRAHRRLPSQLRCRYAFRASNAPVRPSAGEGESAWPVASWRGGRPGRSPAARSAWLEDGLDAPENLVTLCAACHGRLEGHRRAA